MVSHPFCLASPTKKEASQSAKEHILYNKESEIRSIQISVGIYKKKHRTGRAKNNKSGYLPGVRGENRVEGIKMGVTSL